MSFGNILGGFLYTRFFYCKSGPFVIQNRYTSFGIQILTCSNFVKIPFQQRTFQICLEYEAQIL